MADVDYQSLVLPYRRSADQDRPEPARHPVVVVGAGPVGLTMAIDLAQRGVTVVVLDDDDRLSTGSRAICFSKRALEIWDRLGCGRRMADKGVRWNTGRVFFGDDEIYNFDLLPEAGHGFAAFVNLQQYYAEGYLLERTEDFPGIEIRWRNKVTGILPAADGARLTIDTPDGSYDLDADWVIAADGSRSPLRAMMGLEAKGRVFR
ncbi:MAG: FAD-dependent oxidoreductase, partial [Ferrovibrionaceae bacterium]